MFFSSTGTSTSSATSFVMSVFILRLLILLPVGLSQQASTLSGEGTVHASLGEDVVIPWNLALDAGSTITRIVWLKDLSTPVAQLFGATTFVADAAYATRVSQVPGSPASIRLTNMNETDVGFYRCTATVNNGSTTVQLVDTQDLQILVTTTAPPPSTVPVITTLPVQPTPGKVDCRIRIFDLIIFECQALWAAILIIAILVADACRTWTCTCSETCSETCIGTCTGTCTETCICKCKCTCPCDAVKILACFGPLVGVVLAVVVIILASVQFINLPGTCSHSRTGYIVIITVSAVALAVSICAAIAGWWFKKYGNKLNFPVVTVVLEFLLGFTVAIAGIVVSVLYVQEQETSRAGIALGVICLVLLLAAFMWFMYRVCGPQKPTITIVPSSDREVEVKWTGESVGTYTVLYRTKGSHDWTSGPEVSTDDPPNYNYTVQFPQNGTYEVCVQWTITCCLFCCHCWPWSCCLCCLCWGWKMTSEIKEVTVPDNSPNGGPGDHGSSGEQNTPFSPLHGTNTSKTDVPLVFMISEGQSHQVKLEPIAINKQNPTEKREKKKKKRKKVNKVTASDEETKPED